MSITDNLPFAVLDNNCEIDCAKRRDWWKEEEWQNERWRGRAGGGGGKGRVRRRRERGEEWVRGDSKREWKE